MILSDDSPLIITHPDIQSRLKGIRISIMSTADVLHRSVCHVSQPRMTGAQSLYDRHMGTVDTSICLSCLKSMNDCPGHMGHIVLEHPVIHPFYIKDVVDILRIFCHTCYRAFIPYTPPMDEYISQCAKQRCCTHCGTDVWKRMIQLDKKDDDIWIKYRMRLESGELRDMKQIISVHEVEKLLGAFYIPDVQAMGITYPLTNFILSVIPVLPICARPPVIINGSIHDDDLTKMYEDIIKINQKIIKLRIPETQLHTVYQWTGDSTIEPPKDTIAPTVEDIDEAAEKLYTLLKFRVRCIFDNSAGKHKHVNGRALKGIRERLTGKSGQIRGNLMGKRVDQSARTVIGPEPNLRSHELGMPIEIANSLYYSETVCYYNKEKLENLLKCGAIIDIVKKNGKSLSVKQCIINKTPIQLELGDRIERVLLDGDIVLLNRQPTLHRHSMVAMSIRRLPHRTFRFQLSNCKQFNADFDGDEMNIHVPVRYDSIAELEELATLKNNMINVQNSSPSIALCQETLLGIYLMTRDPIWHDWDEAIQIGTQCRLDFEAMKLWGGGPYCREAVSSAVICSAAFPSSLSLTIPFQCDEESFVCEIERGKLIRGFLCKSVIQRIIRHLIATESADTVLWTVDWLQFIAVEWLSRVGYSVGIGDCMNPHPEIISTTTKSAFQKLMANERIIEHPQVRESFVLQSLNQLKETCMRQVKDNVLSKTRFIHMVRSGAKGDFFNLCQMTSLLGQQNISGRRVQPTITQGRRTLVHFPPEIETMKRYEAQGFIRRSFFKGLAPHEFFFHCMSGREGIIDTAMRTAETGYIQRRIVKMCEDMRVCADGTVRGANDSIYQLVYGEDGLDPMKTMIHRDGMALPYLHFKFAGD